MNERVMQFRIGMFVIVAGLVLTMLLIWFGESPSLLRDRHFVIVHYAEAPGVAEGIPVRKSGIRVGVVSAIVFDARPGQPDGVLVTLALERPDHIRVGTIPRITRSLIGDASIDLLPGKGTELVRTARTAKDAPIIEGAVAPDPAKALAAATEAFEKVGETLKSIDAAAGGIAKVTKSAENLDGFLTTWTKTGNRVSAAADGIDRFIKANESDFQPAVASLREVSQKLNATLDPPTLDALKTSVRQIQTASTRLNSSLEAAAPLLKDLGGTVNNAPTTDFGQTVRRLNLIASDLSLLTQALRDPNGKLNQEGSLQRLIVKRDLYDNINRFALTGTNTLDGFKPILAALRTFAEKISRDPSTLARGALQR